MTDRTGLERCWEELAAARLLAGKGFEAQAISRADFAAFFAAEAALLALGEMRSKHSGIVSAFVSLLVRSGQVDGEIGRWTSMRWRTAPVSWTSSADAWLTSSSAASAPRDRSGDPCRPLPPNRDRVGGPSAGPHSRTCSRRPPPVTVWIFICPAGSCWPTGLVTAVIGCLPGVGGVDGIVAVGELERIE